MPSTTSFLYNPALHPVDLQVLVLAVVDFSIQVSDLQHLDNVNQGSIHIENDLLLQAGILASWELRLLSIATSVSHYLVVLYTQIGSHYLHLFGAQRLSEK